MDPYPIVYLGYGSIPNENLRKPPLGTDPNLICDIGYGSVPNVPRWVRIRTKMLIWAMLGTDPYPTCDIGYGSVPDDDMDRWTNNLKSEMAVSESGIWVAENIESGNEVRIRTQ